MLKLICIRLGGNVTDEGNIIIVYIAAGNLYRVGYNINSEEYRVDTNWWG